jgi:hypothetical protein
MNHLQKRIIRSLVVVVATLGMGASASYASFTSNQVTVPGNVLTTGQAAIKVCDVGQLGNWSYATGSSNNLSGLIPDEERELFVSRDIVIGNDNGNLTHALANGSCQSYGEAASASTAPVKLLPTTSFAAENCPDTLPSQIRLRFDFDGADTGYRTLNSWSTNTTQYGPVIPPGGTTKVRMFAQLSSTATAQALSCTFGIQMNGKQPTS